MNLLHSCVIVSILESFFPPCSIDFVETATLDPGVTVSSSVVLVCFVVEVKGFVITVEDSEESNVGEDVAAITVDVVDEVDTVVNDDVTDADGVVNDDVGDVVDVVATIVVDDTIDDEATIVVDGIAAVVVIDAVDGVLEVLTDDTDDVVAVLTKADDDKNTIVVDGVGEVVTGTFMSPGFGQ